MADTYKRAVLSQLLLPSVYNLISTTPAALFDSIQSGASSNGYPGAVNKGWVSE